MPRAQGLPHALRPPPCSRVVRPGRLQLCAGYKSPAAAADCRLEMRPKERGQSCAGDRPRPGLRPGDLTAVASAPRPAASPAPEPSAKSGPASAQAPGVGQGAGSGCRFVSEAPTGARPASEVGVKGNAQSRPGTSDAPWTRFVFQGPFGPRATGLGTGKAADIWKSPAAYIGRRPGVSGPERAAFIRELEEALCPNLPRTIKKITPEDIKVMLYLLEERERDLNTAARIGQSLVKQNSILMEQNSKLEAMLGSAREEILHLRHQVNLRDDLLQLYSDSDDEEEEEDEEEDEEEGEWEEEQQHDQAYEVPQTASQEEPLHYCPQLEALQKRLRVLEEENDQLREEASHLDTLEDEEQMLILECVEQFSEASQQMAQLSEVLVLRLENYERQQKEVTQLQAQVVKLQQRCQSYGAETEKLQQQLASEKEIQMQLQEEETLAEELRTSLQRVISDPVYFTQRNYGRPRGETSDLRYFHDYSEEREQEQGFEAEEGLIPGEDFVPAEELEPEEELRATEEVEAEEGLMDEGELVSEETEAWEEVEPELDEATRMNVVTSALEASGLGPSHLDMKYVLQQLTNWQDAHYRQQLRQKVVQKGECSHRGLTPASQTSCRLSSR
ncbi:huntingtin-associated protein 1 isoform X6 [Nycticebus coucang]|uniref:huntingtin-associated protein 1 isoform X6 n=1 Tax=Nycticebus coucang TaxID=9470 RepID=UPI00234D04D3|nr:huntingtin-associated protein 1 isoform X6 [Nycticebus coucang]